MPQRDDAAIEVTAYEWVPPFARGKVRDLRVRWALEEIGLDYRTRLISAVERPAFYFDEQPFGQVPHYREGAVAIFESGAIALHIAQKDARLLPEDPVARARAQTWLICALNTLEPMVMNLMTIDRFCKGQDWAVARRPEVVALLERRLAQLATALGERDWLEGGFTVGDLMMVDVLRLLEPAALNIPRVLQDYVARGTDRPAFKAAMAAQMADFRPDEEGVPA